MSKPTVVCYGGGVNSLAMVAGLLDRGERPEAIVFSDTRGEKPETYAHIENHVRPWLRSRGLDLTIVCRADSGRSKTGDASLEDECLRLGVMPSRVYGFGSCADKWKIDPFKWWCAEQGFIQAAWAAGGSVVRCIGFDAAEGRRVSEHEDKGYSKRYPLIEWGWDRDQCVAAIARAGLPVPPKSACFFCPSSRKSEVVELQQAHPDLAERAVRMEQAALATGRWAVKGLGRRFAWKELLGSSAQQRDMFPDAPVESCAVCVDDSEEATARRGNEKTDTMNKENRNG